MVLLRDIICVGVCRVLDARCGRLGEKKKGKETTVQVQKPIGVVWNPTQMI